MTAGVGGLVFLSSAIALGVAGHHFLAVSLVVVWLIGLAVVAIWGRRAGQAAIDAEFPARK